MGYAYVKKGEVVMQVDCDDVHFYTNPVQESDEKWEVADKVEWDGVTKSDNLVTNEKHMEEEVVEAAPFIEVAGLHVEAVDGGELNVTPATHDVPDAVTVEEEVAPAEEVPAE